MSEIPFNDKTVELLMNTAKSEYDNEHSRTSIIDKKTSIVLPIVSAYFLAVAQMNDYSKIFSTKISVFSDLLIPALLFFTYTASLVLALYSVIMLVKVISTKEYYNIKPRDLYDEDFLKEDSIFLKTQLSNLYISATEYNKEVNDSRIKHYRRSWKLTIASIIVFVVFIISNNTF